MDALLSNVAHLTSTAGLIAAIAAWCYCVYCCNRIERTRGTRATPMPLRIWLGGEADGEVALYRRRFVISSALFASLIVVNGTLNLLGLA